jgi:rhodanese-related sulfurtransferase
MKFALIAALVFVVLFIGQRLLAGDVISPEEAARRIAAGTAILIDVREPGEWRDGVVTGALLLPLSDLRGERAKWRPVLDANRDKELILYCRSGNRSGQAVRILAEEKLKATNAGGFSAWKSAGQPVRTP